MARSMVTERLEDELGPTEQVEAGAPNQPRKRWAAQYTTLTSSEQRWLHYFCGYWRSTQGRNASAEAE